MTETDDIQNIYSENSNSGLAYPPSHFQLPEQPETPQFRVLRWLPIMSFIALGVLICLSILVVPVEDPFVAAIMIGFLFVQILLAAVWAVFVPINLIGRVLTGAGFVTFVCLCLFRCAYRDGGGMEPAVSITGGMVAQWFVYQVPLWYLRLTGWDLAARGKLIRNQQTEIQFGIRHLLIWMTIVGVIMGFARFAAPQMDDGLSGTSVTLRNMLVFTLGNSLIAMPIVWGCFSRSYFWLWAGITIILCILVCVAEAFTLNGFDHEFYWTINAIQTFFSILALLALRTTGYRLDRAATISEA